MGKTIRKKGKTSTGKPGLVTIRPRVAGIDIGSRQMHVCGPEDASGEVQLAVFDTTTGDIEACAKWLKQLGVESIAMESTGVYWIAPFELLESAGFEVLLVDTRPLSRVPGRKTDVSDCAWIQTLHSCGLLQGCHRPAEQISQLRSIVRMKAVLVSEQADWHVRTKLERPAYSALLLASLKAFGAERGAAYAELPKWRRSARRPSCLDLITLLRKEFAQQPTSLDPFDLQIADSDMVRAAAA